MKSVLCFGDSLTWGYDPATAGRHAFADRWPSVLAKALGEDVTVIPEGLNGRTTCFDDHTAAAERNGVKTLPTLLATHDPLDLVIIFLGTNDLKVHTGGGRVFEARIGMERLVEIILRFPYHRGFTAPQILLIAPPPFVESEEPDMARLLGHARVESQEFATAYALVADEYGVDIFDAGEVAQCSPLDGFHLDAENTRAIGEALVGQVQAILARR